MAKYDISTVRGRRDLKSRTAPYWQKVKGEKHSLSVGFRRKSADQGYWLVRARIKKEYQQASITTLIQCDPDQIFSEATQLARSWLDKLTEGDQNTAKLARGQLDYTVNTAWDDYNRSRRTNKGDDSADRAENNFKKHIKPSLGNRRLVRLTSEELQERIDGMVQSGLAKTTVERIWGDFKASLNRAFVIGKIDNDAAWRKVKINYDRKSLTKKNESKQRDYVYTVDEMDGLFELVPNHFKPMVFLMRKLGLRNGEARTVTPASLIPESNQMMPDGKNGQRLIKIPQSAMDYLMQCAEGKGYDEPLATTHTGNELNKTAEARYWNAAKEAYNKRYEGRRKPVPTAPKQATLYSLRHTYISRALDPKIGGLSPKEIADYCGTSLAMIFKHYAHIINKGESAEKFDVA